MAGENDRFEIGVGSAYGRLSEGFSIELGKTGYYTISGLNNAGKSTTLQWLFSRTGTSIYLPAERGVVRPTIDSGTLQLTQYVDHLRQLVALSPLDIQEFGNQRAAFGSTIRFGEMNSYSECLLSSMIRDKGIASSINELEQYVKDFSLGEKVEDRNDSILIDGRSITQMGTGARSLLIVIMALIHPFYTTVFIDEPELFLEPRAQKLLRNLLVKIGEEKRIVVATHSHLLLDREETRYGHNFYFDSETSTSNELMRCEDKSHVRNLTFKLLGASFDDLMLPENYLIVEGASDFTLISKVANLIDPKNAPKLQVSYAQGIQNAPTSLSAISEMIRPYYAEDSVYKDRVVCLLDEPVNVREIKSIAQVERCLNAGTKKRFFTLGERYGEKLFLESAIPEEVYRRTIYKKAEVLSEITRLKSNKSEQSEYKALVSNSLAASLEEKDLSLTDMAVIVEAVTTALEPIQ